MDKEPSKTPEFLKTPSKKGSFNGGTSGTKWKHHTDLNQTSEAPGHQHVFSLEVQWVLRGGGLTLTWVAEDRVAESCRRSSVHSAYVGG